MRCEALEFRASLTATVPVKLAKKYTSTTSTNGPTTVNMDLNFPFSEVSIDFDIHGFLSSHDRKIMSNDANSISNPADLRVRISKKIEIDRTKRFRYFSFLLLEFE